MERSELKGTFEIVGATWGPSGSHYYRILKDSSVIKYLTFDEQNPTVPDIRGEKLDFATIPEGDWNIGYLHLTTGSDKFMMGATETRAFQSVGETWHASMVDWLALGEPESREKEMQCQN